MSLLNLNKGTGWTTIWEICAREFVNMAGDLQRNLAMATQRTQTPNPKSLLHFVFGILLVMTLPISSFAKVRCASLFEVNSGSAQRISESDKVMERWLREAQVVSIKRNSERTRNPTYWVTLKFPGRPEMVEAIFKPEPDSNSGSIRAEAAAYRFDRMFGFNTTPVTVLRSIALDDGGPLVFGALQIKVKMKPSKSVAEFERVLKTDSSIFEQFYIIRLKHYLIYNKDRNLKNIQRGIQNELVDFDYEFAFGNLAAEFDSGARSVSSFPENLDFRIFRPFYDQISKMTAAQYADKIAPLVIQTAGADPLFLNAFEARALNWKMGILMQAREGFIEEMENRVPELRTNNFYRYRAIKELTPYSYFKVNPDAAAIKTTEPGPWLTGKLDKGDSTEGNEKKKKEKKRDR